MAATCLEHYQGEIFIHVGELFGDTSLSLEQAPWGRSSSPEFQDRLFTEYHLLLRARLPNWLHTVDTLTVWKRSPSTTIVYVAEDDDKKDDEDGEEGEVEVEYRHIPVEERLPVDIAAPCVQHLLAAEMPDEREATTNCSASKKQFVGSPKRREESSATDRPNNGEAEGLLEGRGSRPRQQKKQMRLKHRIMTVHGEK
jgi:hypothetical protein